MTRGISVPGTMSFSSTCSDVDSRHDKLNKLIFQLRVRVKDLISPLMGQSTRLYNTYRYSATKIPNLLQWAGNIEHGEWEGSSFQHSDANSSLASRCSRCSFCYAEVEDWDTCYAATDEASLEQIEGEINLSNSASTQAFYSIADEYYRPSFQHEGFPSLSSDSEVKSELLLSFAPEDRITRYAILRPG